LFPWYRAEGHGPSPFRIWNSRSPSRLSGEIRSRGAQHGSGVEHHCPSGSERCRRLKETCPTRYCSRERKPKSRPCEGAFVVYGVSSVSEYLERATECSGARTKAAGQERQSRRPPCFIRSETRLRGARVVYHQSKRRLDLARRGNDRHTRSRWLLLFFRVYGKRFQRCQELPTRVSDAPTAIIPQHKRIGKNFELWCARGQPPHPIGPIRSA
jgi:hypothetical protein